MTPKVLLEDGLAPNTRPLIPKQGNGHLHLSHPPRANFSTLIASYPLKLLAPSPLPSQPSNIATCYTLAYGGGLVAGDLISLRVDIDQSCGLVMLTQGSTKVFKSRPNLRHLSYPSPLSLTSSKTDMTRQRLHVTLQPKSFLLLMPDSVAPFRNSKYSQTQRFLLPADNSASLLLLDWVSSGRGQHRGDTGEMEIWTMESYASTNEVYLGDRLVMRERMVLNNPPESLKSFQGDGMSDVARRLAPYNVYATILILGPHFESLLTHLAKLVHATRQFQAQKPEKVLWSFNLVESGAGVLRVAGEEVEDVRGWLRTVLGDGGVKELVGDGLWGRII
ncbi:hypothetical protein TREMEDRAFT_67508 [Tremella mesenterica DSM 1558]|uniref:uncharacterized protein n=1 Tax=Tremella mesenterica (strain ATCC 24925 / CBS 8224 / DSM 1558 / NBRC 9311 / NRRL Y-6157 / RJB 2259-6 / UBC 559-6) TaxID=578456 RepID=UPI0003F49ADD|nr:uncharacterized protein TREMEDRAFT_67508 [Tremella mesenterica DSM 1558]EIW73703.1 hypothetical protein TREMEDRAFT_67508 [Tremella mesenterica DSM 1558]